MSREWKRLHSWRFFQPQIKCWQWRFAGTVCGALGLSLLAAQHADASFIGPYALSNFTLNNSSVCALDMPNGSVGSPDGGVTAVLTGSNSGSGCPGMTDLTINANGSGVVQFQFAYSSLDAPMADFAGYLLAGAFTQLADTSGETGTVSFPVARGESFGFRVGTIDNTGEPGVLTISNFSAPTSGPAVPEPGTLSLGIVCLGAILVGQVVVRRSRRNRGISA